MRNWHKFKYKAENNIVKISDFGLTLKCYSSENANLNEIKDLINTFPVKWTAPELYIYGNDDKLIKYESCTVKSDVWSFGIVLYELITIGAEPYPGLNKFLECFKICFSLICSYCLKNIKKTEVIN